MFRYLIFYVLVLLGFFSISCKKQYFCECTFKTQKTRIPLGEIKKKEATRNCADINKAWTDDDGSCVLSK